MSYDALQNWDSFTNCPVEFDKIYCGKLLVLGMTVVTVDSTMKM